MWKSNQRGTLKANLEFIKRLKKMQGKIKEKNGEEPSLTDLTEQLVKVPSFENVEKEILDFDDKIIKINYDRKLIR